MLSTKVRSLVCAVTWLALTTPAIGSGTERGRHEELRPSSRQGAGILHLLCALYFFLPLALLAPFFAPLLFFFVSFVFGFDPFAFFFEPFAVPFVSFLIFLVLFVVSLSFMFGVGTGTTRFRE